MVNQIRKLTPAPIRQVILSHYHADHYYGLQVFKDLGAEVWAHRAARGVFDLENTRLRFEQRKEVLAPWVADGLQRFVAPDRWIAGDTDFELGGVHFQLRHVGPAHSSEDLALLVVEDRVLYAGDLVFKGRIPFVGDADSRSWLATLDKLITLQPRLLVPGHGAASTDPAGDLTFTRDYLTYLREQMGEAVADMTSFEEAYRATDWSRYESLPAFPEANRPNAYNTYLLMEKELLAQ
jgi:glyoxylase-like metal-dependent hydrolase (beta-lactamase superfamily II)